MVTSPPETSHARLAGFSLVEMLISIAIVTILAMLSFAAYSKVTKFSKQAKCISNLRSIGAAEAAYWSENDGWFAANRSGMGDNGSGAMFWCQELLPYLTESPKVTFPTVAKAQAYICPDLKEPGYPTDPLGYDSTYAYRLSYSRNWHVGGGFNLPPDPNFYPPRNKVASIAKPGKMVLIIDGGRINMKEETLAEIGPELWRRHSGMMNLLFVDGHVETSKYPVTPSTGSKKYNWKIGQENN